MMRIIKAAREQRNELRVQFGNRQNFEFSLTDLEGHLQTDYCLCTDVSESGAKFFTNRDIVVGAKLILTLSLKNRIIEKLPVTVVRCNSELNDEERFCCSVNFDQPLQSFDFLAADAVVDSSAA